MSRMLLAGRAFTPYVAECYEHFHADGTKCLRHGQCRGRIHEARLKWRDVFKNIVVTEGLNKLLDNTFNAIAADVNWYCGLIGAGTGTVAITSGTNSVTGTSTTFVAGLATSPIADIIIVGAGAAGADFVNTVATRTSNTAITTTGNAGTTVTGASYAAEPIAGDTLASHHTGWNEDTNYSNANRPTWTKNGAASGGAMSNSSSKAAFSINATSRIFGAFMANNNTKGGTTGVLYGGGLFSGGSRQVQNGDTLNIQIDPSLTAS